jgi:predicted alpha/beta hydrolase family esterase
MMPRHATQHRNDAHVTPVRRSSVRQVFFVQGAGKDVYAKWDNQLVRSLRRELGLRYNVRYPRMPDEAAPKFTNWRRTLVKELDTLPSSAAVVGHSVGGAILISVLAEYSPGLQLAAIVLIAAPFIGPGGWEIDDIAPTHGIAQRLAAGVPVFLYHGDQDTIVPLRHVDLYAKAVPYANVHRLVGRDHQLNNDLSEVAEALRGAARDSAT